VIKEMKTKMTAIFAILMIALMVAGISYAMWDKTLYINGTVNTGEVNAAFTDWWCVEAPEVEGKDVGSCSVDLGQDDQHLVVTIINGYPCYTCTVWFEIENTGTVPVKVQSLTVAAPPPEISFTFSGIAVGDQIDAGDTKTGSIVIHVEQPADELETYTFSIEIYLVQWNEYEAPSPPSPP
jgi:hypothetical protein